MFVIDDKRRTLQQLGGDLVRSLRVTSICFDSAGELYAAGKANLYHVSAAGRVTDAAPLEHLPAIVDAVCAAPPSVTNPDDGRTGSPRKSIFAAVVPTRRAPPPWIARGRHRSNAHLQRPLRSRTSPTTARRRGPRPGRRRRCRRRRLHPRRRRGLRRFGARE